MPAAGPASAAAACVLLATASCGCALQLETGLFVTGASPRGCRRRCAAKPPAIRSSRQPGTGEDSSGFDCRKTPAAVAEMSLRKPAGGQRDARRFCHARSAVSRELEDRSRPDVARCMGVGLRWADLSAAGNRWVSGKVGQCHLVARLPASLRRTPAALTPPLANYASSTVGQRRVHAPGRSAADKSSTDTGGVEPAIGHLGFKHCRPTAETSIPQLLCSGSILSRFRLRPIAVAAVYTYAPAVVFKETNRSVSPETERQLVGRNFTKVRA
jgi:hypothetical protein